MNMMTKIDLKNQAHIGMLLLAVLATAMAIALSGYVGWQRGVLPMERWAWVILAAVMVLGTHLLPSLWQCKRRGIRYFAVGLWPLCLAL